MKHNLRTFLPNATRTRIGYFAVGGRTEGSRNVSNDTFRLPSLGEILCLLLYVYQSPNLMGKQVWQSEDGELFDSEEECLRHERARFFWLEMNNNDKFRQNEERWDLQENFSRHFLNGFQKIEDFWNYSDSFRTVGDILDGKRPDLPKDIISTVKAKRKLLPASKRRRAV